MSMNADASSSWKLLFPEYIRRSSTFPGMTLEEKETFIEELYNISEEARCSLHCLKRPDILELINIETRKECRSTNKTKQELVDRLCSIISIKIKQEERRSVNYTDPAAQYGTFSIPSLNVVTSTKSKRKSSDPSYLPLVQKCQNKSCQDELKFNDAFCKKCSCYICFRYDEKKIPSFWLVCKSEAHLLGRPCGLSCHLECALKERAANMENESGSKMDGSFMCKNCEYVIDLISCWRKLLMEAKDARRLSELCDRIYLSHKILNSSEKYQNLHGIVDSIKRILEDEVGSLNNLPKTMSHRLVQCLSFGREAQKRCSQAIGLLDSISITISQSNHIEEIGVTNENLEGGINVQGSEIKADKSGAKDELMIDLNEVPENYIEGNHSSDRELGATRNENVVIQTSACHVDPPDGIEECAEGSKVRNGIKIGCNQNHIKLGLPNTVINADVYSDAQYHNIVNTVRQMERDGHIDSSFRKEFLTWLSMQASPKNTMQVTVFINTFHDDPKSLAEQLVHTFGEEICSVRPPSNATLILLG